MVDSCFKVFKNARCLRKASLKSQRNSLDSIFNNDKILVTENNLRDKKRENFGTVVNSTDNEKDHRNMEHSVDVEPDVVLRRHNRHYLQSISTTTSDAMSSDEDYENLDVLYPLPHVSSHDRSGIEETNQYDKNSASGTILTLDSIHPQQ